MARRRAARPGPRRSRSLRLFGDPVAFDVAGVALANRGQAQPEVVGPIAVPPEGVLPARLLRWVSGVPSVLADDAQPTALKDTDPYTTKGFTLWSRLPLPHAAPLQVAFPPSTR